MRSVHLKDVVRATVPRSVRNWLRSPSKSIVWLWDCAQFSFGVTKTLDLLQNWRVVCHPYAYKVFYRSQIADCEQSVEFRNFLACCSNAMFLYDIGAHFGIFSLAAAHFGGRAVAVDPSPSAVRMIEVETVLNECSASVQIVCAAVSDSDGELHMLNSGVFSDGYFKGAHMRPASELTRTQAVTVDQLVRRYGIPTHIKIDVEGHEAAVLRGGEATLSSNSPLLFIELHNEMVALEGGDPSYSLDLLSRLNYTTFALNGEVIDRRAILERPIIRVIAKRQ